MYGTVEKPRDRTKTNRNGLDNMLFWTSDYAHERIVRTLPVDRVYLVDNARKWRSLSASCLFEVVLGCVVVVIFGISLTMHTLRLLWAAHNEEVWQRRQDRSFRRSMEMIENITDFQERYRFNKQTFYRLCRDLRRLTSLKGSREISLEIKVLCALSFYATGSYQRIVGISHQLTQRTVSRYVKEVTDALNSNAIMNRWIVFPQSQSERSQIKLEFQRRFALPGVIGCIDCTHVAIVPPIDEEHLYYNRKGYHSLNVQMICDSNLRIVNVNPKFGGATHDSFIWSTSRVEPFMRQLHQDGEQVWLLGDSGYPQRPWLMTPVLRAAPGSREELYTQRHVRARNCIERCFGVLKSRWRCLLKDRTLHYHPHKARKITLACCVLHNMALRARLPLPELVTMTHDNENGDGADVDVGASTDVSNVGSQSDLIRGRATLNSLIARLQ